MTPTLLIILIYFSVNNLAEATICMRNQEDRDEVACLSAYQRNMCLENRDRYGFK